MKRILIISFVALVLLVPTLAISESLPLCDFPAYNNGEELPEMTVYLDERHWLDPKAEGSNPNAGLSLKCCFGI